MKLFKSSYKLLILSLTLILNFSLLCQEGDKLILDNGTKEKIIKKLSVMMKNNYVYPETAEKMSSHLKSLLLSNAYDSINDPEMFAEKLTNDVQSISKDRHLRIRYSPRDAKFIKESKGKEPTPEQQKQILEQRKNDNFGFRKVERLSGNIGYVDFRYFGDSKFIKETVTSVMAFLANTDAIIFDMRFNGGGSPDGIRLICSYLFDKVPVHLNDLYYRPDDRLDEYWTLRKVDGKKMPNIPVYVLTSSFTFSGAEEFTYNLKNLKRAVIVGETTGGGAHPGGLMAINKDFVVFMPNGRAINPITKTNWEGTGVLPDIDVPSEKALETAHVMALNKIAEKSKDEADRNYYLFIAESITSAMNAPVIDDNTLKSYTGTYGDRKIIYVSGKLFYQRGRRQKLEMTPMADDTFMFKDIEYFRLRFDKDKNGTVTGVTGIYYDGSKDTSLKSD